MNGLPMTPTEYASRMRGIEAAAEQVQARIDAGHEFAALMTAGGSVLLSGQWRTIDAVNAVSGSRVLIVCADGSTWLANRTATRPYRTGEGEA